ncbi:MAG TPA: CvpA family protein [Dysgonamonadaceae bacterium]|nr:CvpA family protein [Dysgonamonadaceae bacterium]
MKKLNSEKMMSWFDIIVSLILLASFVRGVQKGLVMQLARLAAIIIGAIFAGKVAKIILPFLLNTIHISVNAAGVISYILAFVVIVFGVNLIGKMLHGLFDTLHISFLNKILGAIISVGSTMVILSILLNLAIILDPEEEVITKKIKTETFFYSRVQVVVPIIVPYLDRDIWEKYIPEQLRQEELEEDSTSVPQKWHS